jgi:hypothetical protein
MLPGVVVPVTLAAGMATLHPCQDTPEPTEPSLAVGRLAFREGLQDVS